MAISTSPQALPLVFVGAGGHARVLHALALAAGRRVIGVCDPDLAWRGETHWRGIPVLGGDEALSQLRPADVGMVNCIGQLPGSSLRRDVFWRVTAQGFSFPVLVHPSAWVAPGVQLAPGVQVMAGAVVQPDCILGENTVINTRAGVDHDCVIGAHVHIAPGATLCGGVRVGDEAFIGSGATVIPNVLVADGAVIGAGVTVVRDVEGGKVVLGAPTRFGVPKNV